MPKKQTSKRQKKSSFLTPDFLEERRIALEKKLADCLELQRLAQQEIKAPSPDDRRGDEIEQALTQGEREIATRQLNDCGKIIPQIKRALDLIDNLRAGEKSVEEYGICVVCEEPITPKRLVAVPWAPKCILCQEKEDLDGCSQDE